MQSYFELVKLVLEKGTRESTGASLASTNSKVDALTVFGAQARFDLSRGFPLLTTKKVSFKSILHELIWFIRGETNIKYLKEHGVSIWDEWADDNSDLGPVYGKQWRQWECAHRGPIDQLQNVITDIKATVADPSSRVRRRIIITAWNPEDIADMALPPCHTMVQFNVLAGKLNCQLYQRSADLFLGVPFNIASYALLTHLVAHVTGLKVGEFIHTFGDLHIYVNHIEQAHEQLKRPPLPLPTIAIDPRLTDITKVTHKDVALLGYEYHPPLKGEVAI